MPHVSRSWEANFAETPGCGSLREGQACFDRSWRGGGRIASVDAGRESAEHLPVRLHPPRSLSEWARAPAFDPDVRTSRANNLYARYAHHGILNGLPAANSVTSPLETR